jgi:4-amino-4-deoxy-L-arabinose transferase-like glycosyltransferase
MINQRPIPQPAAQTSNTFVALTVLAVTLSFFFALGSAPLFDVDEGAFSQATMEMFQRGDFLSTYLNGQPRYDKPILIYWLQALSVKLFGVRVRFRFPSALCGTMGAMVFLFRVDASAKRGASCGRVMAPARRIYYRPRGDADGLLNMLIAASVFSAWLYRNNRRSWL